MHHLAYDAAEFAAFNLETGQISSRENEQLALIPTDVLAALTPNDDLNKATRAWGETHGKRLKEVITYENAQELESLANHIGGALAVFGFGKGSVEIRGSALLFKVQTTSRSAMSPLLPGFLGGFLTALNPEHDFEVIHLESNDTEEILWAGNPSAVSKMKKLLEAHDNPFDALDQLAKEGN